MTDQTAANSSWEPISQRLQQMLNAGTFATWFGNALPLEQDESRLVVAVPNEFTKNWIEGHFSSLLDAAAAEHDLVVELRVAVADAVAQTRETEAAEPAAPASPDDAEPDRFSALTGINPRYTFDVFVIGASNRFAHAAALAVAEAPAQSYNPLFIHGSTGLGKTHLLQAIGHYVLQQHPQLTVRYVTTETVLNEFVDSLRDGRMVASSSGTGRTTSCSSTTSSSSRARSVSRRSFSTRSTAFTRPASRSFSRRIAHRTRSRRSNRGCARVFSGG